MEFSATTQINAAPATVWQILTDSSKYIEWDPGLISMEGDIALGGQLTIYAQVSPGRAFNVTVSEFEPNRRMVWSSGMPFGLFKGARTFLIEPNGNSVTFTIREEFSGLLLPMIGKSIPDMNPVFAAFVDALKGRAEAV
jgi:hypothetical protein